MGVSGFGPAPHRNLDKSERPFCKGAHRTGSKDAPSELPRTAESSTRLPRMASARAGKEAAGPFDVGSSPQLHSTVDGGVIHGVVGEPVDGTANVEGPQALDVDDFHRWWRHSLNQESTEKHYRGPKLTRLALSLGGIALVSSALALKEGAPTLLKGPTVARLANDLVRTNSSSGESAGASPDISTMPPAPVAPAPAAVGLVPKAPAQTADPEPARLVSVPPDGTLIAAQVSTATERSSSAGTSNSESKRMKAAVGTRQPSTDLPAKRPSKLTARVVVAKTETAADAPIPPLPIMTPAKPEEASGAQVALAPPTPAEAAIQSPNPLLRVFGDLFGGRGFDFVPVGSTEWTVKLGAPKSEAEAKGDLKRLNARYGSALKGSTANLRKVVAHGETAYQVHVAGLSRDEAAALCSRVRGDGGSCSIVR